MEAQLGVRVACQLLKSKRVANHRSGGRPVVEVLVTASARAQKTDCSVRRFEKNPESGDSTDGCWHYRMKKG